MTAQHNEHDSKATQKNFNFIIPFHFQIFGVKFFPEKHFEVKLIVCIVCKRS